ncbi:MAG: cell wall-active antibiotics response protein [Prevotellaceae bacterium]|nr:cell wall-active antibiotics response protein [Prevotellaceae bacterium]
MENKVKTFRCGSNRGKLTFGLILMLLGLLFLGFNFGFIPDKLRWIIFSWQMLLVVIGLIELIKRKFFSAFILLVVGSFFLMPKLITTYPEIFPALNPDFASVFWPVLLILSGLMLIFRRSLCPKKFTTDETQVSFTASQKEASRKATKFNAGFERNTTLGNSERNAVFGNSEHIVLEPEFKGAELNAVFGEIRFDLRKTSLPEGDTYLDVNAVFGGIIVFIPEEWSVEIRIDPVFGGYKDYRILRESTDLSRRLIITGTCVFGGVEINN